MVFIINSIPEKKNEFKYLQEQKLMFGATTRNVELNNWYKKVSPILAIAEQEWKNFKNNAW